MGLFTAAGETKDEEKDKSTLKPEMKNAEEKDPKEEKENGSYTMPPMSFWDLIELLKQVCDDPKMWRMTYRTHEPELFRVKGVKEDGRLYYENIELGYYDTRFEFENRLEALTERFVRENHYKYASHREDSYPLTRSFSVKENLIGGLKSKCSYCQDQIPFCPMGMQAFIQYVCDQNKFRVSDVYKELIGEDFRQKETYFPKYNGRRLDEKWIDFLDFSSTMAAIVLLKMGFINFGKGEDGKLPFDFIDFSEDAGFSYIPYALQITNYTGPDTGYLDVLDAKNQIINTDVMVTNSAFGQKPELIAAYIYYLAGRERVTVMQMSSIVAQQMVERQDWHAVTALLLNQHRNRLHNMPFTEQSMRTVDQIINYITNRCKDMINIPFMLMNTVIYSNDEKLADEVAKELRWFLFWFNYYPEVKLPLERESLADLTLDGLIKIVNSSGPQDQKILYLKDFDILPSLEDKMGTNRVMIERLVNALERKEKSATLFLSGEKSKLEGALRPYSELNEKIFLNHIYMEDMSIGQIARAIISDLRRSFILEEGFEKVLRQYVANQYGESELKNKSFIDRIEKKIIFNHYNQDLKNDKMLLIEDIPTLENQRSDEDIWREIDRLKGLDNVKEELHKMYDLLVFRNKAEQRGVRSMEKTNMHMVFKGNPGTGKTTVARLLGELLYNMGYLKQNKLVEVSPKDMVGQYVGQTAPLTASVCESAYGGILFIDEAYELATGDLNGASAAFRSECITELVKQMEDHRDKLIVIMAGYEEQMDSLLDSNPGLRSRINNHIMFYDYELDSLMEIFKQFLYKVGMTMTADAEEIIAANIKRAMKEQDFGNARYVRNLYEKALFEHARNTAALDADDEGLLRLTRDDVLAIRDIMPIKTKNTIGFI